MPRCGLLWAEELDFENVCFFSPGIGSHYFESQMFSPFLTQKCSSIPSRERPTGLSSPTLSSKQFRFYSNWVPVRAFPLTTQTSRTEGQQHIIVFASLPEPPRWWLSCDDSLRLQPLSLCTPTSYNFPGYKEELSASGPPCTFFPFPTQNRFLQLFLCMLPLPG